MTETVSTSQDETKKDPPQPPSSPKTKSKAIKPANEGNDRPKSTDKAEKPPTKVVVRRLPPTMNLETFLDQVAPLPPVDYMYFVKADSSLAPNSFARAYLHFVHVADLLIFTEKFDNYVFVDSKGNEYPAIVEYAPFQRIPKQRSTRKKDPRVGTIENDPYYQEFIEALKAEESQRKSASKTNKQHFFETSASTAAPKVTSTPLLEFLKARRADKLRTKEDKIAERKKREMERRKAREDARSSVKPVKLLEGDGDYTSPLTSQIKPPQPICGPSSDLAEIQTRYLRCMMGLDADTSGLEQVSCSACHSNEKHAPFACEILRQRMHFLLLHINKDESRTVNSIEENPPLVSLVKINLQQSMFHSGTTKSITFQNSIPKSHPEPQTNSVPVNPSLHALYGISNINQNIHALSESESMFDKNGVSLYEICADKDFEIVEETCKNSVDEQVKPYTGVKNELKINVFQDIAPFSNPENSMRKRTSNNLYLNSMITSVDHLSTKTQDEPITIQFKHKDVDDETKSHSKLTELFQLLESGAIQVQSPSASQTSVAGMIPLTELESKLLLQQKMDVGEKNNSRHANNHKHKCASSHGTGLEMFTLMPSKRRSFTPPSHNHWLNNGKSGIKANICEKSNFPMKQKDSENFLNSPFHFGPKLCQSGNRRRLSSPIHFLHRSVKNQREKWPPHSNEESCWRPSVFRHHPAQSMNYMNYRCKHSRFERNNNFRAEKYLFHQHYHPHASIPSSCLEWRSGPVYIPIPTIAGHKDGSEKLSKDSSESKRFSRDGTSKDIASKRREDDRIKLRDKEKERKDKEGRDFQKDSKRDTRKDSAKDQTPLNDKDKDKENQPTVVEGRSKESRRSGKSYQEERQRLNDRRQAAKGSAPKLLPSERTERSDDSIFDESSVEKKATSKRDSDFSSDSRNHYQDKYRGSEQHRAQSSRDSQKFDKSNKTGKEQEQRRSYDSKKINDEGTKSTSAVSNDIKSEDISKANHPKEETRKKSYNQEREQRRKNQNRRDTVQTSKSEEKLSSTKGSKTEATSEVKVPGEEQPSEKLKDGKGRRPSLDNMVKKATGDDEPSRSKSLADIKTSHAVSGSAPAGNTKRESTSSRGEDKKDPRTERRIRNKDRPSIEIYRPGMGRFSRQRLEREKVLTKGSSTERDSPSSSPSPVPSATKAALATEKTDE